MMSATWRWTLRLAPLALLLVWAMGPARGQAQGQSYGTQNGEWQTYGGDLRSTRYSPLDQVSAENFNKLEVAWRFKTDALGPRPEYQLQTTPLMVKGVLYFTAGTRRAVVAVDGTTGEMLWMHSVNEGKRGEAAPRQLSGRGVTYWTDGREDRIIYVTPGYQMIALDAKTGETVKTFGKNGVVDLKYEDDQEMDLITGEVGLHSAPIVANNVIVIGAAHLAGGVPKSKTNQKGYIRGLREDRQAPVDLPHHSSPRRGRQRHVGGRLMGLHWQCGIVGADECRRVAWPALPRH